MRAAEIIDMIPDEMLEFFTSETKADYKVQKLKGSVLFKLLIYSLLTTRNSSLECWKECFTPIALKLLVVLTMRLLHALLPSAIG